MKQGISFFGVKAKYFRDTQSKHILFWFGLGLIAWET